MNETLLPSLESPELGRLLEDLHAHYGIDFRDYSQSSMKRRIRRRVLEENVGSIAQLHQKVLTDPASLQRLLTALTIHVTALFRDPHFYLEFRRLVVPILKTYPYLRFWVAGCSTGEEVYSLAILLHEEGLYERSRIYATDINDTILNRAKTGIFPISAMQEYTRNYQKAGGHFSFAEYYTADSDNAILRPYLRQNMVFAAHNLVGDASFNEFHGIFCRNVMIYFNRTLQNRVHQLFYDSLLTLGYLGLGRSETIRFTPLEKQYETISASERLYRKNP